ncbi:ABC transporter permease [Xanthobacteraceae bacterium A53D]
MAQANTAKVGIGTETGVALPASSGRSQAVAGLSSILLPLGLAFFVLLAWQAYVTIWQVPSVILPSPISIAAYIWERHDLLLMHAIPTTLESAAGFLLALLLGVAIAILLTYSPMAHQALYPNLIFFQLIPKIALAPLFIIWLGVGTQSRIAFSVFIAFFPVVIATTAGFQNVDRNIVRLCRSLTATEWQIFTNIRFPMALPHIFSGMKIAITLAIIGVIIGEFITAQAGLGYLIIFATARADTEVSMAAIVVLCICGLLLYGLVALAELVTNRLYSVESR